MRRDRPLFRRRRRRGRAPLWLAIVLLAGFLLVGVWRPDVFLRAEFARQRWQAGASVHETVVDGRTWRWLEAGSGPPLVLLHGFTGSKENWLPVFAALAERHRVIAPDLPGWGYFDPQQPQPPYGYEADAERLSAFLRALPGQPVDLVGHSMGGGIAALFAARHPDQLQRLVLLDAAGAPYDNAFAEAVRAGQHPFAVDDRASLAHYLDLVFADPPWVPWPVDQALIDRRIAHDAYERAQLQAISTPPGGDAPLRAAARISVPTLLLWCRDDRVVDPSAAERYAEQIPDVRTELLDGCNHMPMMERPDATVAAIERFLR